MPSRNTLCARNRGFSDIKQMNRNGGKDKNYGVKLGYTVDSEGARKKSGKAPYDPPRNNSEHWK